MRVLFKRAALLVLAAAHAPAADPSTEEILRRLDRLEKENQSLREEVRQLRSRIDGGAPPAPGTPPIEERLQVQERRIDEHQQTKVESAAKAPVRLTGMLMFNVFRHSENAFPLGFPTMVTNARAQRQFQGTMRQTLLGLEVESPVEVLGARARGNLMLDFFAIYEDYQAPRIRTAALDLDWTTRSLRAGIEKSIIAPRNPTSLAMQIWPALWGSGNLWLWQPQVRLEQRFRAGGLDIAAQGGVVQTNESRILGSTAPMSIRPRPGWQGRVQFAKRLDEDRAIEFAPGFHYSRTHYLGASVPSQLVTGDLLVAPSRWWELSSAFFHGRNAAPVGGMRQGIVVLGPGQIRAVGTTGGWAQWMVKPTDRVRFHFMGGTQDDRNRDLLPDGLGKNLSWAVNGIVQLSPNVVAGVEIHQIRSSYVGSVTRVLNRYDIALGYLFSFAVPAVLASEVTGRVELRDSREKTVRRGLDFSGVVVWLEPLNGRAPGRGGRATMLQKGKRFSPHVLPVRTGTAVEFPNLDPIFHNAFSNFSGQIFDVGLYKPGSTRTVMFNRPGIVRVFCNIHAAMSAVIIVVDSPWYTVTRNDGSFRIADVPPGEYRLEVFHERATSEELSRLSRVISVGPAGTEAGRITISEAGFLPVPHLNKHHRPYPPAENAGYKVLR